MKQLKAKERLIRSTRCWSQLEIERQKMVNENRINQMERLRPLSTMGVDVEMLCTAERISPMLHRNEALANARHFVAQKDRQQFGIEHRVSKEQSRLLDLAITRRTAEDRAESMWRISNQIPLSATMDSLKPEMMYAGISSSEDASHPSHPEQLNGEGR